MSISTSLSILNYRVTEKVTALTGIKTKNFIYLGPGLEDSSDILKLKKTVRSEICEGTFSTILDNSGFQVKFEKSETWDGNHQLFVYIKHDELPDKDTWYNLRNWNPDNLVLLYNNLDLDENGVLFNSENYELVFNGFDCILLKKESEEYETISYRSIDNDIFDTMTKTSKRISGNCYLGKNGERHLFLGEFWRLSDEKGTKITYNLYSPSRFNKSITTVEELIKDKIKTSDFSINEGSFRGRTYGILTNKRWVNIGSKLKPLDKSFDIRDFWEYSAEKYVEENKKPYSKYSQFYYYSCIGYFFKIFTISSSDSVLELDAEKVTPRTKEIAKDILKSSIFGKLYRYYWLPGAELPEKAPYSYSIKRYKKVENNGNLMKLIYSDVVTDCYLHTYPSLSNGEFFKVILEKILGIDFKEVFEETLEEFKEKVTYLDQDLQSLINWKERARTWSETMYDNTLGQVEEFDISRYSKLSAENDLYENWPKPDTPHLREILLEIYEKSLSKSGSGVTDLEISQYGTQKNGTQLLRCTIDIEDIVDHFGGDVNKVPENIVKELLRNKLTIFMIRTNNKNFKIKK